MIALLPVECMLGILGSLCCVVAGSSDDLLHTCCVRQMVLQALCGCTPDLNLLGSQGGPVGMDDNVRACSHACVHCTM